MAFSTTVQVEGLATASLFLRERMTKDNSHSKWKTFIRWLAVVALIAISVFHMIWPSRLALDWQSVALIAIAVVLGAANHLANIIPLLKSVKAGELAFEFKENVDKLNQEVKKAEESKGQKSEEEIVLKVKMGMGAEAEVVHSPAMQGTTNLPKYPPLSASQDVIDSIYELARESRVRAIVYIAQELERTVENIHNRTHPDALFKKTGWALVDEMVKEKAFTGEVGDAIKRFWNIRNDVLQTILPTNYMAHQLDNAIDSGIRLLRMLM
jgi:hypothetical protein